MLTDIGITVTNNGNPKIIQFRITNAIALKMFGRKVLHTVKLDNQMRRGNIKISDVITDPLLTINSNRQLFKAIPHIE